MPLCGPRFLRHRPHVIPCDDPSQRDLSAAHRVPVTDHHPVGNVGTQEPTGLRGDSWQLQQRSRCLGGPWASSRRTALRIQLRSVGRKQAALNGRGARQEGARVSDRCASSGSPTPERRVGEMAADLAQEIANARAGEPRGQSDDRSAILGLHTHAPTSSSHTASSVRSQNAPMRSALIPIG
jgi:hypothetical protein